MTKNAEIMLMDDVKYLGKAGDIVSVAPGYARNFLIPQGLAAPVTEAARRRLAKLEAERQKARAERKAAAEALAAKLAGLSITVNARTKDDSDELYGSVNTKDLIAAVEANRGVTIERSQLNLPDQLKKVGTYNAKIDLGEGVTVPFDVIIVAE